MITLTDEQIDLLEIDRFIFHVVHHGESEPLFFDEVEVGEFEEFFLDRVKDILGGTAYEFNGQAQVSSALESIRNSPGSFVEKSKQLAVDFHAHGLEDKRIKKGVMILMKLSAQYRELLAIIKYEHEQVLRYRTEGTSVVLENVADTFTKSPDAMQKAALIDMTDDIPQIMVLDSNTRSGISGFFQGFLNVRRVKNDREMTEELIDVVKETSKKHADELPREVGKELRQRASDYMQSSDKFDNGQFFDQVFGPYANDSIQKTYHHSLQKHDLENEQFYLDKEAVPARKKSKIRTAEGVSIYFDERGESTIKISYGTDGEKDVIVIESSKLKEEYL